MKHCVFVCDLCGAKFASEGRAWAHLDSCKKKKKHLAPIDGIKLTTQEPPQLSTR